MITDYILQDIKGIKKSFDNASNLMIEQFIQARYFNVEVTDEFSEIFTSTEGMTGSRKLSELETPPTLALEDGYTVTLTNERFGGAILVSSTDRQKMKDSTVKVKRFLTKQRNQLLIDNKHLLVTRAHLMLNEAFSSGSDFLAPDGVELCGAHSWATGTTFNNKATSALDQNAVDTAIEFGGAFTAADGKEWPQNYDVIVVKKGSANARMAKKLFAFGIKPTAIGDINIYEGEFIIIETPFITSTNTGYWFMLDLSVYASPLHVGITKVPTLMPSQVESNEAIRTNCEGFWNQGVNNMPFNVYGADGTT